MRLHRAAALSALGLLCSCGLLIGVEPRESTDTSGSDASDGSADPPGPDANDGADGKDVEQSGHDKDASNAPDSETGVTEGEVGTCATCTSSSYEDTPWSRKYAVDGEESSVGSTFGYSSEVAEIDPSKWSQHAEWIVVHLPARETFSQVVLYPRNDPGWVGEGFPIDFKVQVWDGAQWLDRVSKVGYPKPGDAAQGFAWEFSDTTDYIRIYGSRLRTVGTDGYLMQFAEIEVGPTNFALGAQVSTTSSFESGGWERQKLVDGHRGSVLGTLGFSSKSYTTAEQTEEILITLPEAKAISNVVLYPRNDDGYRDLGFPVDFTISFGNGSGGWTTRVTKTNYPAPGGAPQVFTWGATDTTNQVRISVTRLGNQPSFGYCVELAEVELY
jgi:hypothetical protein